MFTQWEKDRNRWKINNNFENKQNQLFFELLTKQSNKMGCSWTIKKRNKKTEHAHL